MIEEYERFLKCSKPLVFHPNRRYFAVTEKKYSQVVYIHSEAIGGEYDLYQVKVNKALSLAMGYGADWFFGDQLNDLCLEECE